MQTLAKQQKQLTIIFGNIVMKAKTETELIADSLLQFFRVTIESRTKA